MHLIVLCIYPLALLSGLAGPGCAIWAVGKADSDPWHVSRPLASP